MNYIIYILSIEKWSADLIYFVEDQNKYYSQIIDECLGNFGCLGSYFQMKIQKHLYFGSAGIAVVGTYYFVEGTFDWVAFDIDYFGFLVADIAHFDNIVVALVVVEVEIELVGEEFGMIVD